MIMKLKYTFLVVCMMMLCTHARAQIISTIAGRQHGYGILSDEGGPALSAQLRTPYAMATDPAGNIYFTTNDNRIRKLNAATNTVSTIAGTGVAGFSGDGGAATSAQFHFGLPSMAVDASGNIYISDDMNSRIRKITASTGIVSTILLSTNAYNPLALTLDGTNTLYYVDNNYVRKINLATLVVTNIGGNGSYGYTGDGGAATAASFGFVERMALYGNTLYLCDEGFSVVRRIKLNTGVISTYAGNGSYSYTGDGGQAISAGLGSNMGIAVDASGNLFIGQQGFGVVRKIDQATKIITTAAGTGITGFSGDGSVATAAQFNYLTDIIFDASGNMLICDYVNNRLRKIITSTQIVSTIAGNGTTGISNGEPALQAYINSPFQAVAFDALGNMYIADEANQCIRKINATTQTNTIIAGSVGQNGFSGDGGQATAARLSYPSAVAIDASGNIYIVENGNGRVRKITAATGVINTFAGGGGTIGDGIPATSAQLTNPVGICINPAGDIFVSEFSGHRIRRIDHNTNLMYYYAGTGFGGYSGDGGQATSAGLNAPAGISIDNAGNLLIADFFNHRIRKVDAATKIITTVAGNGTAAYNGDNITATAASLSYPLSACTDNGNNMYIADGGNSRVRKVNAGTNTISTFAGTGVFGYSGDGGAATSAQLSNCGGVAVNSCKLYITDNGNNVIRAVSTLSAQPVITASGSTTLVCPGKTVLLTSSSINGNVWSNGATTQSIVVSAAGTYSVSVYTAGCAVTSNPVTVTYDICAKPTGLATANITATSAKLSWNTVTCAAGYQYEIRKKGTATWTTGQVPGISKTITGLAAGTTYQWRVATACKITPDTITSNGYTNGPEFTTLSAAFAGNGAIQQLEAKVEKGLAASVMPNPARSVATVKVSNATGMVRVRLTDLSGKLIWQSKASQTNSFDIDVSGLAQGTYMIMVNDDTSSKNLKLIKE